MVAGILAGALALASQETAKPSNSEAVERGRQSFADNCAVCHGDDATGGRGPDLMHSKNVRGDKNGDLLTPLIKTGNPDKGMPALGLSDGEIADLVAFLHAQMETLDRRADAAGSCAPGTPAEKLPMGSAESGKAIFESKCASCHSANGDLKGISAKNTPPQLLALLSCPPTKASAATVTTASAKQEVKPEIKDAAAAHHELLSKFPDGDVANLLAYLGTLK